MLTTVLLLALIAVASSTREGREAAAIRLQPLRRAAWVGAAIVWGFIGLMIIGR